MKIIGIEMANMSLLVNNSDREMTNIRRAMIDMIIKMTKNGD